MCVEIVRRAGVQSCCVRGQTQPIHTKPLSTQLHACMRHQPPPAEQIDQSTSPSFPSTCNSSTRVRGYTVLQSGANHYLAASTERSLPPPLPNSFYRAALYLLYTPNYTTALDMWSIGCIIAEFYNKKCCTRSCIVKKWLKSCFPTRRQNRI